MCSANTIKCQVCNEETSKYKCPKCLLRYCSVACFRTHKESKCEIQESILESGLAGPVTVLANNLEHTFKQDEESEDRVPEEIMEKLGHSDRIKDILKNPHLRTLVKSLDSSNNPDSEIQKLMKEPLFSELADEIFKVIEPNQERH